VLAPLGLAANLLAVPWTGLVLLPASLAAALAAGAAPEARASAFVVHGVTQVAEGSLAVARAAAEWAPAFSVPGPARFWLAAAGLGVLGVVRARRTAARVALGVAIPCGLALAPPPAVSPPPPRVVFLDVGQGDAVLVQGRKGVLLVDAGLAVRDGPDLGARVVVPALRALGVGRLDLVAASHGDLDHRGGLPAVLRALPVERVWLPHGGAGDAAFAETVRAARALGATVEEHGAGSPALRVGDLRVVPLWPPPGPGDGSRNDRSLTLRVEVAGRTVLLPGDLEASAEGHLLARGAPLRADVLKLGHHGSRSSSSAEWLEAVGGAVAVASAPRFGRFGMPHPEVVARAHAAGYALWWTGRDGAVLVGLEPVLHVRGWRPRAIW
jgi:competence protein ComEC